MFATLVTLVGCATQPVDVHTASTTQLLNRRAELERRVREDQLGVYFGPIRWISHAAEEKGVKHEIREIDAELTRRQVKVPESAATPADMGAVPTRPRTSGN